MSIAVIGPDKKRRAVVAKALANSEDRKVQEFAAYPEDMSDLPRMLGQNFDVVMMAQKDGPQRVANIGKLIEITRQLARQGTTALDDIVRYLRERCNDPTVRESEAQIVSQDDDVVRVLTVHQAKGLEFDIVIIPDLAAKSGRSAGDRTFFSDRWLPLGSVPLDGRLNIKCSIGLLLSIVFIGFALAFAIKLPLVPFHTWLPDLYEACPPAALVFFAGIVSKLGAYGFIRFR